MGTIIGAGVGVLLVVWVIVTYNVLVRRRNRVEEAWSGIDVQLQRRADLVPNLVDTVKAYKVHEEEILTRVAEARSRLVSAEGPRQNGVADDVLEASLKSLFAVVEAYPELKASENFLALQRELSSLEEEISFARRYYNALVEKLNSAIQVIPTVLIARPMGFQEAEYFKAEGDARAVPNVAFGGEA